jgi:hypothetical protein
VVAPVTYVFLQVRNQTFMITFQPEWVDREQTID